MANRKNISDILGRFDDPHATHGNTWLKKPGTVAWKGPCYETHPPLALPSGGQIFGGSCATPIVKDAEIYIGFDAGFRFTKRHFPWEAGTEIEFLITDMRAPKSPLQFRNLVEWTLERVRAGQRVHCGCIGGHGRTGTFLAALVASDGVSDAITYVREHYCARAVESTEQINFLADEYGVVPVKGSKVPSTSAKTMAAPPAVLEVIRFDHRSPKALWPAPARN